jgi:hypothetical protein
VAFGLRHGCWRHGVSTFRSQRESG